MRRLNEVTEDDLRKNMVSTYIGSMYTLTGSITASPCASPGEYLVRFLVRMSQRLLRCNLIANDLLDVFELRKSLSDLPVP